MKLKPHKGFKYPDEVDYTDFCPIDTPPEVRAKLDVGDIFFNQVRHTTCGWYIRSKNRHDYRKCFCGKLAIDGGSWYTKLVGDIDNVEYHVVKYNQPYKDDDDERESNKESSAVSETAKYWRRRLQENLQALKKQLPSRRKSKETI